METIPDQEQPFPEEVQDCIRRALAEDIGPGDVTTESIVPPQAAMNGKIVSKQAGIIAGLDVAGMVYRMLDEGVYFFPRAEEGECVENRLGDHTLFIRW